MSNKQKHLDFLKDLRVLMQGHGVVEIFPTNDYNLVFKFSEPTERLEIETSMDMADFDKLIGELEKT